MILTVTPNPAIDVTYAVSSLRPGRQHRVDRVTARAGGKGVNVARVLHQLDKPALVTGLSGGPGGQRLERELTEAGVPVDLVHALPDIRTTLVVHDGGGVTTSLWEPGPRPEDPAGAARALLDRCAGLLADARALVVSGSLPAGVDPELPARLAALAAERGVPALVDADGEALRAAAHGCRAVLMPNQHELAELVGAGGELAGVDEVADAVGQLCSEGVPAVVVTLGADGMLVGSSELTWWAAPVVALEGNPTGAGDAAAAAVATGLAAAGTWPEVLADAVALSAAAVASPVAGAVDLERYRAWRPRVRVRPVGRGVRR